MKHGNLIRFFLVAFMLPATVLAQDTGTPAQAVDPGLVVPLDYSPIYPVSMESRTGYSPEDTAKEVRAACVARVHQSVFDIQTRLQDRSKRREYIGKIKLADDEPAVIGEESYDLAYYCRSLIISSIPAQTVRRKLARSKRVDIGYFFHINTTPIVTETTLAGGNVVLGCEQRSLMEKARYSMARRCEKQPTEECIKMPDTSATRFVNSVDSDKTCELAAE